MRAIDTKINKLIGPAFDLFKKKNPLIAEVATALLDRDGADGDAAPEAVGEVLKALFKSGDFPLQVDELTDGNKDVVLAAAKKALDAALGAAGAGTFVGAANLSIGAIKALKRTIEGDCEQAAQEPPKGGKEIAVVDGRHVLVVFIHEDENKLPLLPAIEGGAPDDEKRKLARARLLKGFKSWQAELEMDITLTEKVDDANIIVTGRHFGNEVSDATLALTDVGPPRGRQLRMVFDLNEKSLDRDEFQATAAHELGHALGVSHRHVPKTGVLMSPKLSSIIKPLDGDVKAAVQHGGWIES